MREQSNAEADRPAALKQAPWNVIEVRALPDSRLHVRFEDGTEGDVNLSRLIDSPQAGVFAVLSDPSRFARVEISDGAVTWPKALEQWPWDLDLAPDAMHDAIAAKGEWIP
jgi:hypothetical protein